MRRMSAASTANTTAAREESMALDSWDACVAIRKAAESWMTCAILSGIVVVTSSAAALPGGT